MGRGFFFFNELYFRNTGWPLVHAQVIWASLSSATNELLICFLGLTRCKILGTAACVPSPRPWRVPVDWVLLSE